MTRVSVIVVCGVVALVGLVFGWATAGYNGAQALLATVLLTVVIGAFVGWALLPAEGGHET